MSKAKVVFKQGSVSPNGREMRMQLRSGEKGTGKVLQEVICWPWSARSMEEAERHIVAAGERHGVEVVWPEAE